MFDHINFLEANTDVAFDKNTLVPFFVDEKRFSYDDSLISRVGADHADFLIKGSIKYLPHRPISKEAYENYLYIISFGIIDVGKDFYTRREHADSYLVLHTYDGEGILEYDNRKYHLEANRGFLIDCRKPHYYYTKGRRWHYSALHFDGIFAGRLYQTFASIGDSAFLSPENGRYLQLMERLIQIYDSMQPFRELQISSLLQQILVDLIVEAHRNTHPENSSATPEKVRSLIHYIEENFSREITLDLLSDYFGVSKFHLSREFRKHTGISPISYLTQVRMNYAKFLLTNTDMPIGQIGETVGIEDRNNFLYQFKKHAGMAPSSFRKGKETL